MAGAFEIYLRTGQVRLRGRLEVKFNSWHDPADGRFTFRNTGTRYGTSESSEFARRPNRTDPRVARLGSERRALLGRVDPAKFQLDNPRNHSIHIVRRGETLGLIARTRKGLHPRELAELNSLRHADRLTVGQQIKLPHQSYLDEGQRARAKVMALAYYMDRHEGRMPPNVANPPSIESQIDAEIRSETRNGHVFKIDAINRTRHISVNLASTVVERRSRSAQRNAGKPDRLRSDDGGHYVAPGDGGPPEWFNHFAQDANFNRGAYRVIENKWRAYRKAQGRGTLTIKPLYDGLSQRPRSLVVRSEVDGVWRITIFKNRKGGK